MTGQKLPGAEEKATHGKAATGVFQIAAFHPYWV